MVRKFRIQKGEKLCQEEQEEDMAADRAVQEVGQVVREVVAEAQEDRAAVSGAVRECPRHRAEDGAVTVIRAEDAAAFRFFASLR
ncbi:MAG: hypothetical protein LUG99_16365 [Lachnospiraceae bacterium]|nr:hypothetical protein [Lachnospiraceae bacterium]